MACKQLRGNHARNQQDSHQPAHPEGSFNPWVVCWSPTGPSNTRWRRCTTPPRGSYPLAQHQYRNEVPQHHHRDLPSSRAVCHSSVLSNQHSWGCGKFGTKRPQVQILSPRPVETFFPTLRGIGKEERGG